MPVENTCRHVRRESQRNAGTIRVCLRILLRLYQFATDGGLSAERVAHVLRAVLENEFHWPHSVGIPGTVVARRGSGGGAVRRVLHEDGRLIGRTYENVERAAALAPGLRDFFRSCAVWRLTKMDRIFPSTVVRVRSLTFGGAGEELCLLSLLLLFVVTPLDSSEYSKSYSIFQIPR
jgi:hypothetical protein